MRKHTNYIESLLTCFWSDWARLLSKWQWSPICPFCQVLILPILQVSILIQIFGQKHVKTLETGCRG